MGVVARPRFYVLVRDILGRNVWFLLVPGFRIGIVRPVSRDDAGLVATMRSEDFVESWFVPVVASWNKVQFQAPMEDGWVWKGCNVDAIANSTG